MLYCEISPRQSGKTTRLIQAASDYLRHNPTHKIAIVGISRVIVKDLKEKIILYSDFFRQNLDRITFLSSHKIYDYNISNIDYWFFNEFGYMREQNISHPTRHRQIIENAYYCTTPTIIPNTTNLIIDYCLQNNIQIHWNNPWTESHIMEQNLIGLDDYTREVVLGDWVRFMESKGLFKDIKINFIRKEIKKHRFRKW